MDEVNPMKRKIPGNLDQIVIVTFYELLKYLRSKRLIGTIAIVALILSLIYLLPPALDNPYTGEREINLEVNSIPPQLLTLLGLQPTDFQSMANFTAINRVEGSLIMIVDGAELSGDEWIELESGPLSLFGIDFEGFSFMLFKDDLTSSSVIAKYEFKTNAFEFMQGFLGFAEILIIICVTLFGADALVSEFQNRTAYLLFPNPLRKEVMYLGKFIASFIACFTMIALYYIVISILSYLTIGDLAPHFILSFSFAVLFLLSALGLAFLIGSIFKGSTGAIVLTFFLLIMIIPLVESVGMFSGMKPWFLLTFAADSLIYSPQLDNYPVDTTIDVGQGLEITQFYPELGLSAIVLAVYAIVMVAISIFLFKRKQLTG